MSHYNLKLLFCICLTLSLKTLKIVPHYHVNNSCSSHSLFKSCFLMGRTQSRLIKFQAYTVDVQISRESRLLPGATQKHCTCNGTDDYKIWVWRYRVHWQYSDRAPVPSHSWSATLTCNGLDPDAQKSSNLPFLTHNSHSVDEGHWVQEVTEIHKGSAERRQRGYHTCQSVSVGEEIPIHSVLLMRALEKLLLLHSLHQVWNV